MIIEAYKQRPTANLNYLITIDYSLNNVLIGLSHCITMTGTIVLGAVYFKNKGAIKAMAILLGLVYILDVFNDF
ncbi:MAG: hypothetical protein U5L45_21080 [Saprospiraceae bacterium]|nr:hypothetical protein [Saprospiraceae bacterium]